jgi:hypothetical protein
LSHQMSKQVYFKYSSSQTQSVKNSESAIASKNKRFTQKRKPTSISGGSLDRI